MDTYTKVVPKELVGRETSLVGMEFRADTWRNGSTRVVSRKSQLQRDWWVCEYIAGSTMANPGWWLRDVLNGKNGTFYAVRLPDALKGPVEF
jgi:hypothetical protein